MCTPNPSLIRPHLSSQRWCPHARPVPPLLLLHSGENRLHSRSDVRLVYAEPPTEDTEEDPNSLNSHSTHTDVLTQAQSEQCAALHCAAWPQNNIGADHRGRKFRTCNKSAAFGRHSVHQFWTLQRAPSLEPANSLQQILDVTAGTNRRVHLVNRRVSLLQGFGRTSCASKPVVAPTPPVAPTLAAKRTSRPAPFHIIQYYSGETGYTHALTFVSYAEPPMEEDQNSLDSQYSDGCAHASAK